MQAHRELVTADLFTGDLVTVDLGNSTCKARVWRVGPELGREGERAVGLELGVARSWPTGAEHSPNLGSELAQWRSEVAPTARVALSSVAADDVTADVERALGAWLLRPLASGLRCEYRTPETLGTDRLFAARGAIERVRESCLVVDAGTAVTVDAVRVEAAVTRSDAPGGARCGTATFLGGAIAPGPTLLARALHAGTARLPEVEPRPGVPALGRDTQSAVLGGVVHGFAGLVRGLVESVAREAGLEDAPVVLGGGARVVLGADPCPGRRVVVLDELVHLGLAAAACDALRAGAGDPTRAGSA
ncbi:MAG: type III pantothenate kinase [Planctomycetes bacterium]|nr:type III pantothenate kinase [Planctomycetota bacterium]